MNSYIKEWLSVAAMFAVTGFFYMQTPANAPAGSFLFPNLLMALMAAMAAIKAVSLLLFREVEKKKEIPEEEKPLMGRFIFVIIAFIAYVFAVDHIGFFVSSFVFFFGVSLIVQLEPITPRVVFVRLLVVLGFLYGCNIIFKKVLMAHLPRGILF